LYASIEELIAERGSAAGPREQDPGHLRLRARLVGERLVASFGEHLPDPTGVALFALAGLGRGDTERVAGLLRRMEDGSPPHEVSRFGDALRRFVAEDDGAVAEPGEVEVVDLTRERGGLRRRGRT